jgi:outer membrane lipoprotein-sorting protein
MKIKLLLIKLIFFLSIPSWSQSSIEAKNLLEKASKKLDSYISFEFEFSYVLNNRSELINEESKGKVTVSGDRYKLNFLDAIQLFDGETIYTIVPENEEITLIKATDDEEDIMFNPTNLISFYKKGYDYHWDISQKIKGKNIQFIKLIPTVDDSDIKSILVGIDTYENHIYRLIEVGLNGTITTLTINSMEINKKLSSDFFVFDPSDYPNYYINE